ncbi:cytochrome P450 4F8-like [Penaeus monodon]|uniref:cytochrome P450 4F8-like n=1 Tax=Penaeus monodon TaxID=6687 RepID=UPI0018A7853F|nr:cytochrome P450 4F8-like [Penaeus monodon]
MLPLAMIPLALLAAKTGQVVPEARNDHQAEAAPMTKNHRVVPHARNDHQAAIAITERPHLHRRQVVQNPAYMFVLAGYETTANAIAFTSYTLARYPQWQELCVQELRKVMEGQEQRVLTYEQVSCLHVLERVFQETLRIYPPVPSFVTREAGLTREVGGVTIPSGVNVTVPVWHIHHDPALWPDPEKFDPDRDLGQKGV